MAWWIVGIVFRHVPDMAAITAAVVVHFCVFARSRKPLNMLRSTGRTSGVGHRGRIEAEASKFRAHHEDVSFACIVGTSRTSGQFRTKEVAIEMLTKLTAGMNFSMENQTRGSSLRKAVDTVWQRLYSVVREPQRQDSIAARARPSRCPERDQSQGRHPSDDAD